MIARPADAAPPPVLTLGVLAFAAIFVAVVLLAAAVLVIVVVRAVRKGSPGTELRIDRDDPPPGP